MTAIPWEAPAALAAAAVLLLALPRAVRSLRRAASGTARPQRSLIAFLLLLGLCISGATFISVYRTVTAVMEPYMGWWSWTVPVSGEIAFMFAFGCGVVLAARKVAGGEFLRGSVMAALAAGSVVLNVWAARGVVPDVIGHLEVVGSFFGVALIGKSTIMAMRGGKLRADRITAGEWIAHPLHSARLWRWMMTWGEPSRRAAHERYMRLLFAITIAQADQRIGRRPLRWRRNLTPPLRYQLATGQLPEVPAYGDWQEAIAEHVGRQLAMLPSAQPEGIAGDTAQGTPDGSGGDTGNGTPQGITGSKPKGTREGSDWPETKDVNKAVLRRRVKAACERYEAASEGRHLPATQLSALLKVRMSRGTATELLRAVYGTDGGKRNEGTG